MLSLHCHPAEEACPGQRCSWQGQGASCCCSRIPGPRNAQGGSPGVGRGEWPEGDEQGWAAAKPPAPALRIQDRPVLGTGKTPHLREMFKSFHGKSLTTPSLLSQPGTGKGSSASSMLNCTDTNGQAGITSSRVVSAVPLGVPLLRALQGLVPTLARSAGLGFETPGGNHGQSWACRRCSVYSTSPAWANGSQRHRPRGPSEGCHV